MKIHDRICRPVALVAGAMLLCLNLPAGADEMQDINALFKQGQHDQALNRVNAYLASKPKDAQARFLKGLILTEKGQPNDAIAQFSALTEDYPELPEPYNNLAVLYAGQGQYDKARQALEMAIRTHPSYATAHENLGDIYARMASQAYDRALQLDRGNTSTQTKLAMIKDLFVGNKGTRLPVATASAAATPTAPPVTVAAKPQPATPVEKPAERSSDEIIKTVRNWADAWSSKNVKKYLDFYAGDFRTPGGESRDSWAAMRAERIAKPKSIQVGISNARVNFTDDSHATVTFLQSYRASHLKTSSTKTLLLVNSGNRWLIQEERSEK